MDTETLKLFAPYLTIITGVIIAYLSYKSQLRLKSFELFLKRREEVLSDIEREIVKLQKIKVELSSEEERPNWVRFSKDYFHNGIILRNKIDGANFSRNSKDFTDTYWSIITEPISKPNAGKELDIEGWISRQLNILSTLYGHAHSEVNKEIEMITLPWYQRLARRSLTNKVISKLYGRRNNME